MGPKRDRGLSTLKLEAEDMWRCTQLKIHELQQKAVGEEDTPRTAVLRETVLRETVLVATFATGSAVAPWQFSRSQ